MLEVGSLFDGKYKILNELGHGGMSTVYLALNERANKTWAIKEVRKDGQTDNVVVGQSLVAEIDMLKKLNHPHIVNIVDVVENDDSFIIVMEYIEGRDLMSVVQHNGPQDPDLVVKWMKQLCEVMSYLHSRKPPIIYRDMKPANVMLKPNGDVIVIDFGTARTNKGGSIKDTTWLGTRGYAAPEQFGGQGETDARTDIYTLGSTMYHLITGYSPADTNFVIYPLGQLRPELTGSGIEKIVAKCCEPRREDRYQSAEDLLYDLEHVHDGDNEVLKADARRWRLFLLPVITTIIGIAGMIGFTIAKANTIKQTYTVSLSRAKMAESIEDGKEDFINAISMRPSEAEGYQSMLKMVISDGHFSSDERMTLNEVMSAKPLAVNGDHNFEVFESQNPKACEEFKFELGKDYFSYFSSGFQYASQYLEGLNDSNYLDANTRKKAASYYLISNAFVSKSDGTKTSLAWTDDGTDWHAVWDELNSFVGDPNAAIEICGDKRTAIAVYRVVASMIVADVTDFQNGGVTREEMESMLKSATTFMGSINAEGPVEEELIFQTNSAIESAGTTVRGAYHVVGMNR